MHSYYNSHNKQYRKEISGLCSVIRSELEELFSLDSDSVVREIQDVFETKLLLDMPYICNIDFETAAAYGVPYYRNETIACGDVCCANLVKRNAPVIMDNYPPHCLRGDGLK